MAEIKKIATNGTHQNITAAGGMASAQPGIGSGTVSPSSAAMMSRQKYAVSNDPIFSLQPLSSIRS